MSMEMDDVFKYSRFDPTPKEAVTYYLPRLIAGSSLNGAEKVIHEFDIYSCEPKDLAYQYDPAPHAMDTGDRFFFTTCKRKNGSSNRSARVAGGGTWTGNKTQSIVHAGVKVGEVKSLSFKKEKACTGWVMEEYRCMLPQAVVADGEKVLCKIHLSSSSACAAARQESAAYLLRHRQEAAGLPVPEPETITVTTTAQVLKRPAPVAADDLSCSKKLRMAAPVQAIEEEYQDCPDWFAPPAPFSLPAEAAEDMDRFTCTVAELLGETGEQAENNIEQFTPPFPEPASDRETEEFDELEMLLADL
ncbi:NAC domain-containing protein 83-like [Lolium rigidum]|uniref:NAC domain-containing protein 83-like n=1 Tax=Lolium rigidum TaxID=89674 RepID=UPI001F5E0FF7|nr:NAC domain-containing protein 83-like [Lolium rigidum]